MASTLCRSFHRLRVSIGLIPKSNYSSLHQSRSSPTIIPLIDPKSCQLLSLSPSLSSLDLNIRNPGLISQIIDLPVVDHRNEVINPRKIIDQVEKGSPGSAPVELPTNQIIEKEAARLIVIRRHKMKKHKKRKLKKKMKFLWRKYKQRRVLKKEKRFHREMLAQIRRAERFDPATYIRSRLDILDNVRIPNVWKGEVMSESMVKKFMQEEEEKKLRRLNRPRLTLD
ncbi:uncharacterized protein LOC123269458 [Cotesia glomerata]|uniref:Ribosomal protein mS38 C-terminal domain-containing protein n=1 Tax=Cotesia glomerata TaxID=32391 RepID=A0AAV7IB72_COTGL|nr:uncharacterized protein LOC123269458 [Cotesia glomerata]KAH0547351.1 hypothetical protein KQX54_018835 [Cotesia glomerata]